MLWKTFKLIGGAFEVAVGVMLIYRLGFDAGKKSAE